MKYKTHWLQPCAVTMALLLTGVLGTSPSVSAQEPEEQSCLGTFEVILSLPAGSGDWFNVRVWLLDDYLQYQSGNQSVEPFYGYLESDPNNWGPLKGNPDSQIEQCIWAAETNWEGPGIPAPNPLPQEIDLAWLPPNTAYVFEFENISTTPHETYDYTYYSCVDYEGGGYQPPMYDPENDGFYCPYEFESTTSSGGVSDMMFVWDGQSLDAEVAITGSSRISDEMAAYYGSEHADHWVLSYDSDAICVANGSNPAFGCTDINGNPDPWGRHWFVTPQVGYDYTFAPRDLPLREEWTWTWTNNSIHSAHFQPGSQLVIEGSLKAEDVVFTAADSDGWAGVYYTEDSGGDLRGVTIEDFGPPNQLSGIVCGLTVDDRWLAVYRSLIQDGINGAIGACAYGDQGQLALRGENGVRTRILRNDGGGLLAASQGRIFLREADVEANLGDGGRSVGTGARIYAYNSLISDNEGVALAALNDGHVFLYDPNLQTDLGENELDENLGGGLLAQGSGSYINAGTYDSGDCVSGCENNILNHHLGGIPFEVKSTKGTLVFAEYDHWGLDRDSTDLNLDDQGGLGMILINPIWDGTSLRSGEPVATYKGDGSGNRGSAVRNLIVQAFQHAEGGDWAEALALAEGMLSEASSGDELEIVMGTLSALLSHAEVPELPTSLTQAIQSHLSQQGRPFALRTLMSAHRVRGRGSEARTLAQTLLSEYPRTEHALTGLAQEVELALQANALRDAQSALATMLADFPEEALTRATLSYFALVAGRENIPEPEFRSGDDYVVSSTRAGGFTLLPAYPNPFNPQTVVPFSINEASQVEITVLDLLGREVATLVNDRYDAGVYETVLDGATLPSGMYLVRANITRENSNTVQTFTQRLTLLK